MDGVKSFTRAYMDEAYFWYREIPPIGFRAAADAGARTAAAAPAPGGHQDRQHRDGTCGRDRKKAFHCIPLFVLLCLPRSIST
jgi:hypothetical protein